VPLCVGGIEDHVHILVGLKPTHTLSDFVRELKKNTTNWVKEELSAELFAWQEGYSAFTVSASAQLAVRTYIQRQVEHHRSMSFRDELKLFLKRSGVQYDPKYFD
jgi:REP element-mobilizing transposase RayT